MAVAAAAATVCVASPSSPSFSAGASSWECGRKRTSSSSRVLISASSCSVVSSPLKAECTSSIRESWAAVSAINRLSTAGSSSSSNRPRTREWRWQAVAEQLQAEPEEASEEGGFPSDTPSTLFEAEGFLPEASVAKLTSTLEAVEGVSDADITASSDGTATVKEVQVDLQLPRRRLLVEFTCNVCQTRTQRLVNPEAYERGTVYVQCGGCEAYHKLVDNLGLVVEYDFRKETDPNSS